MKTYTGDDIIQMPRSMASHDLTFV